MTNYQCFFSLHDCTFKRMVEKKKQKSMSNIRNKIFDILLMYFHNDGFDGSPLSFSKTIYTFLKSCNNNHYIPQRMIIKHGSIIFSDSSSSLGILNNLYEHFRKISAEITCFRADRSQTKIKKYLDNSYYCYSNHVFNSL